MDRRSFFRNAAIAAASVTEAAAYYAPAQPVKLRKEYEKPAVTRLYEAAGPVSAGQLVCVVEKDGTVKIMGAAQAVKQGDGIMLLPQGVKVSFA